MTHRWTLHDQDANETWTMTLNPNEYDDIPSTRPLSRAFATRATSRLRSFQNSQTAQDWQWRGIILNKQHYDKLLEWSRRSGKITVTTHLGQSFEIMMQSFVPQEPAKKAPNNWKMKYTMNVKFLRRLT